MIAGSRTVNVLPLPSPSLSAVTVPPCISTSPFTSASPMPSPPVERSMLRSTWENMSKMLGRASAGMPIPVSRTETTDLVPRRSAVSQICPPRSVYLALLVSRLPEDLGQPGQVGVEVYWSGGSEMVSLCPPASMSGPGRLHGGLMTSASSTRCAAQLHLVAADAGDVEQVVDQPHHVAELPFHHVAGLGDGVASAAASRITCRPLRSGASGLRSSWASRRGTRPCGGPLSQERLRPASAR